MTAQTREFPTILVMMSMEVTAVMPTSADSDISEGFGFSHVAGKKRDQIFHFFINLLA